MSKSVVSLPMYFLYNSQMVFKICRLRIPPVYKPNVRAAPDG